jgi:hypothetical protein
MLLEAPFLFVDRVLTLSELFFLLCDGILELLHQLCMHAILFLLLLKLGIKLDTLILLLLKLGIKLETLILLLLE